MELTFSTLENGDAIASINGREFQLKYEGHGCGTMDTKSLTEQEREDTLEGILLTEAFGLFLKIMQAEEMAKDMFDEVPAKWIPLTDEEALDAIAFVY